MTTQEHIEKLLSDWVTHLDQPAARIQVVDFTDGVLAVRVENRCQGCPRQLERLTADIHRTLENACPGSVHEIVSLD